MTFLLDTLFYTLIFLTLYILFRFTREKIKQKKKGKQPDFQITAMEYNTAKSCYEIHFTMEKQAKLNVDILNEKYISIKNILCQDFKEGKGHLKINISQYPETGKFIRFSALGRSYTRNTLTSKTNK